MPPGRGTVFLYYVVAIVAAAAVSVFLFVGFANFLSFTLSLTEAVGLYDWVTEYCLRTHSFSQFLQQTAYVSLVYGALVLIYLGVRRKVR